MQRQKKTGARTRWQRWYTVAGSIGILILLVATFLLRTAITKAAPQIATAGDWATYWAGPGRSGYNATETIINRTSAPNLRLHWVHHGGGSISGEPIVVNGVIYWGSWDGYEHASNLQGTQLWQTFLGQTTDYKCHPSRAGVASTATVASIMFNGVDTSVVFVGGGNATIYALNATTGAIIWKTPLGPSPSYFAWSSPVFYQGSIFVGSASFGDCPLTPGQLLKMDATTGAIQYSYTDVPDGCVGGGIWSSPAIDTITGDIYVTTGTYPTSCHNPEPQAIGIVELRSSDLTVVDSWQVPPGDRNIDSDFGATPTLFVARVNGAKQYMVGAGNKNGKYYAFIRGALSNGPVWKDVLDVSGLCPQCGQGIISNSAFDGGKLYVAAGSTTVNGVSCPGFLAALNPADGSIIWKDCLADGPVLGGVSVVPGLAIVGEGNTVEVVNSLNGQQLASLVDTNSNSRFYGGASISNGVIYSGNMDGSLLAYGL